MGLGVWGLPQSPRWLLLRAVQGKASLQEYKEQAIVALSKLRGRPSGDKVSEKQIEDTLVTLKSAYGSDEESEGSIFEVFQGTSLKAFVIGGGLVLFQQVIVQTSIFSCFPFINLYIFFFFFFHKSYASSCFKFTK